MSKITKGYFLTKLFKISDTISAQMKDIFVRNNVPVLDLKLLPESDRELFRSLHEKSNRVGNMICKVILEKP